MMTNVPLQKIALPLLALLLMLGSLHALRDAPSGPSGPIAAVPSLLSPYQLATLAGGFAPALADVHWIRAVGLAGNASADEVDAQQLYDLLDRVVTLDPAFKSAYQYGALLLSVNNNRTDLSDRLLVRAVEQFPEDWGFPFYLGFNRFYYATDFLAAADYFEQSARLAGAPPFVGRLAVRFRDQQTNQAMAAELLDRLIQVTTDAEIKTRLTQRLADLKGEQ